jgi:hypothetical protein
MFNVAHNPFAKAASGQATSRRSVSLSEKCSRGKFLETRSNGLLAGHFTSYDPWLSEALVLGPYFLPEAPVWERRFPFQLFEGVGLFLSSLIIV